MKQSPPFGSIHTDTPTHGHSSHTDTPACLVFMRLKFVHDVNKTHPFPPENTH